MKIALFYRHIDPADTSALEQLIAELQRCGVAVTTVHESDSIAGYDYLFSVGGDGTFLTTVGKENVGLLVQELLEGRFSVEERTLLQLDSTHSDIQAFKHSSIQFALNEVFIHRREEGSLLRTQVFVDDDYVATYAGDGVIVATPTGSTAYSLSCGGPILTPTSRCFAITPISAHTLTLRPIIIPDTARISLRIEGEEFTLGIDSHRHILQGGTTIDLCRAPFTIKLIRISSQNFFSAIRDKLMWGTEARP